MAQPNLKLSDNIATKIESIEFKRVRKYFLCSDVRVGSAHSIRFRSLSALSLSFLLYLPSATQQK